MGKELIAKEMGMEVEDLEIALEDLEVGDLDSALNDMENQE